MDLARDRHSDLQVLSEDDYQVWSLTQALRGALQIFGTTKRSTFIPDAQSMFASVVLDTVLRLLRLARDT